MFDAFRRGGPVCPPDILMFFGEHCVRHETTSYKNGIVISLEAES